MDIDADSLRDLFELDECATKRVMIFDNSNNTLDTIVKKGIQTPYTLFDLRDKIEQLDNTFSHKERSVVIVNENIDIDTLPSTCKKHFTLFIKKTSSSNKYHMISFVDNLCS